MEKTELKYEDFLYDVDFAVRPFVDEMHEFLLKNGCDVKLAMAKSGYVVSYVQGKAKRTVMNYVFRKKGLVVRIYGDHIGEYVDDLQTLPESMKKAIVKAPVCRRLIDPTKCNQHCPMGVVFVLDGEEYKKCRYGSLMFPLSDEANPYIRELISKELRAREVS